MKKFKWFLIAFFLTLLCSKLARSQEAPDNLFVVMSWDANPPLEKVEKYRVEWNDAGREWVNLGDVVATEAERLNFSTRVSWIKSTITIGNTLCFRVIALRGTEESEPSEQFCETIQPAPAVSSGSITKPSTPSVEFQYRKP